MAYIPFHEVVSHSDVNYRSITFTDKTSIMPLGQYGFVQMYCDDLRCDCRRVLFHVMKDDVRHALVGYGWDNVEFYRKWFRGNATKRKIEMFMGPALHDGICDFVYSALFVNIVNEMLSDIKYKNRIIQNYKLFRNMLKARNLRDLTSR